MKISGKSLIFTGIITALSAGTAVAQSDANSIDPAEPMEPSVEAIAPSTDDMTPADTEMTTNGLFRGEGSSYQFRASDLLGMDVINGSGDEIGEIDDLTVGDDGSIQAILALGGFLGLGEKMVTLNYENMQFDDEREHVVVDISEEELDGMDDFRYNEGEQRGRDITPGMY